MKEEMSGGVGASIHHKIAGRGNKRVTKGEVNRRQLAESRRQRAEGRRRVAEGNRQKPRRGVMIIELVKQKGEPRRGEITFSE
jgi:hypothetical protein